MFAAKSEPDNFILGPFFQSQFLLFDQRDIFLFNFVIRISTHLLIRASQFSLESKQILHRALKNCVF